MNRMSHADLSRRQALAMAAVSAVSLAAPLAFGQDTGGGRGSEPKLDVREIPSSGVKIPSIGLGTSQQFNIDLQNTAEVEERKAALQAFYDAGGRLIDTAPSYGTSEPVVGALTADLGLNDKVIFATKVGIEGEEAGIEQMRQSLENLKREKIEFMQVHNLRDVDTQLKTLRKWKEDGTLGHIGVTHFRSNSLDDLLPFTEGDRKVDVIQLNYNIEDRQAEERLLPACRENGVATIINVPFGRGGLFGKVRGRELPEHAQRYANSWAQAFLKFLLANEAVTCIIPGTSDAKHATDNCGAMTGPLPTEEERRQLLKKIA